MASIKNTGKEILDVVGRADRFNEWMYQTIKPFIKGNILEIGSGIGNLSSFFIKDNFQITLSDNEQEYVDLLKTRFKNNNSVNSIERIDLEHPEFERIFPELKEKFDTVFLLNVLEHIMKDQAAINNCMSFLKPGGQLLILTPAYSFLYSSLDKALGHYRRYTIENLNKLIDSSGLIKLHSFYFNFLGIFAWFYGKIFQLKTIPAKEMQFFNQLTPFAKIIDKIIFRKAGLSVICVAKKRGSDQ